MFRNSRLTLLETKVRFASPQIAIARSRWRIIDSQNTDIVEGVLSRPQ